MGLFYTGKGDKGKSVVGKKKIDKTCLEIEGLGDLDELNSLLGLVKSKTTSREMRSILHEVQENLFIVQANLAHFMFSKFLAPTLKKEKIAQIEKLIDEFEKKVKPEKGFIVSGSNEASAWLDYARAVARRAERSTLAFSKKRGLAPEILAYVNRLSSLLFAMGRMEAKKMKQKEGHPRYR